MKATGSDLGRVELGVPNGHTSGAAWAGVGGKDRAPVAVGLGGSLPPGVCPWNPAQRDGAGQGGRRKLEEASSRKPELARPARGPDSAVLSRKKETSTVGDARPALKNKNSDGRQNAKDSKEKEPYLRTRLDPSRPHVEERQTHSTKWEGREACRAPGRAPAGAARSPRRGWKEAQVV